MSDSHAIKWSVRTKFYALIVTILIGSIGALLSIAVSLYEEDKMSYVYEVSGSFSRSLASQTQLILGGIIKTAATIDLVAQDELSNIKKGDPAIVRLLKDLMAKDRDIIELTLIWQGEQIFHEVSDEFLLKHQLSKDQLRVEPKFNQHDLDDILEQGIKVESVLLKKDLPTMLIGFANQPTTRLVLVARIDYERLHRLYNDTGPYTSYLVNHRAEVVLHPSDLQKYAKAEKSRDTLARKILNDSLEASTELMTERSQGEAGNTRELLYSFVKIPEFNLVALSTIPLAEALSATEHVIRKSLLFGLAILTLALILAGFFADKLTDAIAHLVVATHKIGAGDFDIKVKQTTKDEMGWLTICINKMATEILRLMEEVKDKIRMEKELETAKTVQETLFPSAEAHINGFDISAFYTPAAECGGDWYGYEKIGDELILMIGDATGHGVPSALITAAAQSCSTTLLGTSKPKTELNPSKFMHHLNRAICLAANGRVKMTFFVAVIHPFKKTIRYCNASHELPLILRVKPNSTKREVILLDGEPNSALGMSLGTKYQVYQEELQADDLLCLYTDGLLECRNATAEEWGEMHFLRNIKRNAHMEVKAIKEELIKEAYEFSTPDGRDDDITFIIGRCVA